MSACVRVSVLLALVVLLHRGDATVEKFFECCKTVSDERVPGTVTGVLAQKQNGECVHAYIVQTEETNLFCVYPRAKWVLPHVKAQLQKLQAKVKAQTAPNRKSLLSILTTSPSRAPLPTSDPATSSSSSSSSTFSSTFSSTAPPPTPTTISSSSSSSIFSDESSSAETDYMI